MIKQILFIGWLVSIFVAGFMSNIYYQEFVNEDVVIPESEIVSKENKDILTDDGKKVVGY